MSLLYSNANVMCLDVTVMQILLATIIPHLTILYYVTQYGNSLPFSLSPY